MYLQKVIRKKSRKIKIFYVVVLRSLTKRAGSGNRSVPVSKRYGSAPKRHGFRTLFRRPTVTRTLFCLYGTLHSRYSTYLMLRPVLLEVTKTLAPMSSAKSVVL
jgi:hypothetical protein